MIGTQAPRQRIMVVLDELRLEQTIEYLENANASTHASDLLAARRLGMAEPAIRVVLDGLDTIGDSRAYDNMGSEELKDYKRAYDSLKVMMEGIGVAQDFARVNFANGVEVAEAKAELLDAFLNGQIDAEALKSRGTVLEALAAYRQR
jgi:hypothetical protein